MTDLVHALVQDTDDCYPVACLPKIDDVLLDTSAAIALPYDGAVLGVLRRLGQTGADCFDKIRIAECLW